MPDLRAHLRRLSRGSLVRDLVLFSLFATIVIWSLFFSLPRPGAKAAARTTDHYAGDVVVLVRNLSPAAWPEVRVGDAMPGVARVTRTEATTGVNKSLLVSLRVTGPLDYLNLNWPFPPRDGPMKIGSMIAFETERYRFIGEVVRKSP